MQRQRLSGGALKSGALLGHGHLAMTIEPGGEQNRYQGIVALEGESLDGDALRRRVLQSVAQGRVVVLEGVLRQQVRELPVCGGEGVDAVLGGGSRVGGRVGHEALTSVPASALLRSWTRVAVASYS